MRLGRKDSYSDSLLRQATSGLQRDAPYPAVLDAKGRPTAEASPAFTAWAKDQGLPIDEAAELAKRFLPATVLRLGESGDVRAQAAADLICAR